MKITYDASVDAAYIRFTEEGAGSSFGFTYTCDPALVAGDINLDFSADGRLIGIEVLQASKKLPLALLNHR